MTEFCVTRRGFLGATLASVPVIGWLARAVPIRDSEFELFFGNLLTGSAVKITTYLNGRIMVQWEGLGQAKHSGGDWVEFEFLRWPEALYDARGEPRLGDSDKAFFGIRCRRPKPKVLDIEWLYDTEGCWGRQPQVGSGQSALYRHLRPACGYLRAKETT